MFLAFLPCSDSGVIVFFVFCYYSVHTHDSSGLLYAVTPPEVVLGSVFTSMATVSVTSATLEPLGPVGLEMGLGLGLELWTRLNYSVLVH